MKRAPTPAPKPARTDTRKQRHLARKRWALARAAKRYDPR